MISEIDKSMARKKLKESRFNGLAYWEIFECVPSQYDPTDKPKRKALVYGTFDQAVDYAVDQPYFLSQNEHGVTVWEGFIGKIDVGLIDLTKPKKFAKEFKV